MENSIDYLHSNFLHDAQFVPVQVVGVGKPEAHMYEPVAPVVQLVTSKPSAIGT